MAISLFGAAQMTLRARRAMQQVGRRKTNATGPHRHAASRKQSQRTRARKQDQLTHREQTGGRQTGGRVERGRGLKRDKPAVATIHEPQGGNAQSGKYSRQWGNSFAR